MPLLVDISVLAFVLVCKNAYKREDYKGKVCIKNDGARVIFNHLCTACNHKMRQQESAY